MTKYSKKGPGENFIKCIWRLKSSNRFQLVQYIGDPLTVVQKPHGNSKRNSNSYVRTAKSTLNFIKKEVSGGKAPMSVYQDTVLNTECPDSLHITTPKN